jgi:hypothetical protein
LCSTSLGYGVCCCQQREQDPVAGHLRREEIQQ